MGRRAWLNHERRNHSDNWRGMRAACSSARFVSTPSCSDLDSVLLMLMMMLPLPLLRTLLILLTLPMLLLLPVVPSPRPWVGGGPTEGPARESPPSLSPLS